MTYTPAPTPSTSTDMASGGERRHRMITHAVLRQPDALTDAAVHLWESLAIELISIIGERGFESLYARSLHRTCTEFPWLTPHSPQPVGAAIRLLARDLQAHHRTEAGPASAALLITFIDTLILLIGELVTSSILRKAWGDDVVDFAGTDHQ